MGWTKRQLIEDAYAELALASYVFDLTPEELQWACRRLDTLMGMWSGQGVNIGYAFGTSPTDTDLDQESGVPLVAVSAVYLNLAVNLAAGKGKNLARSTTAFAKAAYDSMLVLIAQAQMQPQQFRSGVPQGGGNKPYRNTSRPFLAEPTETPLGIGGDGGLVFNGM